MSVVKKCFKLLQLKQHFDAGIPEREVIAYLKSWNNKLKSDEYGNLFLINPGTPLLCAHMDTVQRQDSVDNLHTLRLNNGVIKAKDAVIGGDDKCGIAIAMEIYERLGNKVSLLFTRQEEVGCVGATNFVNNHSNLVSECRYGLVLDRRGAGDIIGYKNQYCSQEFEDEIYRLTKEFGYKPETGYSSDAGKLAKIINCVNLSVGYYNPHTKNEFINCNELENALEAAMYIVQNFDGDYPIFKLPEFGQQTRTYKGYKTSVLSGKIYNYPLSDDYDENEDKREKYRRKLNKKKEDDMKWINRYIEIKDGMLIVKKDIFVTDIIDDSNWAELPEGSYAVCEYV